MKLSQFNIVARGEQDPSKFLLYNTLHDHRILFDDPELNPEVLFDKIKRAVPLSAKESEAVPDLKEMGILLDDDVDEQRVFEEWYDLKIRNQSDLMQITILPLMGCNLACHYCFENAVREKGKMTPEMTDKVIAWIHRRLWKFRPKSLHIHFFGGEPLLHTPPIKKITKALWEACQKIGAEFEMGMITNGVLLTPEFVDELVPYGFKWVKITFDGDKEAHDHKRVFHGGKGTFDTIYNNLCAVAGKLRIAIGGNFDAENYDSMFQLVERLKQSPFADDIFMARFKPIMKINPVIASQREGRVNAYCDVCSYNNKQVDEILSLQNKTSDVGLPIIDRPDIGPCEYHLRHSVTIAPDGSLYKCPGFVGLRNLIAGDVEHDDFNERGESQIASKKWDHDCESCHFLPNCVGGCKMSSLNKTGSLEIKSCEGNYLEKATQIFMQEEIRRLSASPPASIELPAAS
ncbi:MAG: radical SAM protein [bacterium]